MIAAPPPSARRRHEVELAADPGDLSHPRLSAVTCPVRSISSAELIARSGPGAPRTPDRGRSEGSMLTSGFSWRSRRAGACPWPRRCPSAAVNALARARDDATLDQGDRGVDQQRVQREVRWPPSASRTACGIAPTPTCTMAPSGTSRRRDGRCALDLADRRRRIRESGSSTSTQQSIWPRCSTRCRACAASRVDLRDHQRGAPRRRERDADRDAEAQIAAGVGRRAVHQDAVRRPRAARHELRHQIEVPDRHELDASARPRSSSRGDMCHVAKRSAACSGRANG